MPFVNLNRTFRDVTNEEQRDSSSIQLREFRQHLGLRGIDWDELLQGRRVVLIAEAGAGKTQELKAQQSRLEGGGKFAFFIPIERVCTESIEAFLQGERALQSFTQWRDASSEKAWFFLDSVDEMKLARHTLEEALRAVVRGLGEAALPRAHFVISSRPLDWRPIDDRVSLDKYLLKHEHHSLPLCDDDAFLSPFREPATKEQPKKKSIDEYRLIALLPLTHTQQRMLAAAYSVTDLDKFFGELGNSDVGEQERTPQDIIDLAELWRSTGKLGNRKQQLAHRVQKRLSEKNPSPHYRNALSYEKALDGAQRLALALLRTGNRTIQAPAQLQQGENVISALDCAEVLPDWSPKEIESLLHLALFLPSSYGRIRFDHRSSEEYLTAQRLLRLSKERGMPKRQLLKLFFDERYGERVVIPSMTPVAAWVALDDQDVLRELLARDPEILVLHADAASLPLNARQTLVREYVRFYGRDKRVFVSQSVGELRRLAIADMSTVIRECFCLQFANDRPLTFLLKLIWLGALSDCIELIRPLCFDASKDAYVRTLAVRAAGKCEAKDLLNDIARSAAIAATLWPTKIIGTVVEECFPDHCSFADLEKLIRRASQAKKDRDGVESALEYVCAASTLPERVGSDLVQLLSRLLIEGKAGENRWDLTSSFDFVAPALLELCNARFALRRVDEELTIAATVALRFGKHHYSRNDDAKTLLRRNIANADASLWESIFWHELNFFQALKPEKDPWGLWCVALDDSPLHPLTAADMVWLQAAAIDTDRPMLHREVALRIWSGLWFNNDKPKSSFDAILLVVRDEPTLRALLEDVLRPAPKRALEDREKREHARKDRETAKKQHVEASWLKFRDRLVADPETMFHGDRRNSTLVDLADWLRRGRNASNSKNALENWSEVRKALGDGVGDGFEGALHAYWRSNAPELRSKTTSQESHHTTWTTVLALTGLSLECAQVGWLTKLSDDEMTRAAQWAMLEMNGFPSWFSDLAAHRPNLVKEVILTELDHELALYSSGYYPHILAFVQYGDDATKAAVAPRLYEVIVNWPTARLEQANPQHDNVLQRCMEIVVVAKYQLDALSRVCDRRFNAEPLSDDGKLWLQGLAATNLSSVSAHIQAARNQLTLAERSQYGIDTFAMLFGRKDYGRIPIPLGSDVDTLVGLVKLAYLCVPPAFDPHHDGSYTPNSHDDAVTARGTLVAALGKIRGMEAHRALRGLASAAELSLDADYLRMLAHRRAAEDSELSTLSVIELNAWSATYELPPRNNDELHALVLGRLEDIAYDLRHHDFSQRTVLHAIKDEKQIQVFFARLLEDSSRGMYTVDREVEVVNQKKPDIRVAAKLYDGRAAIEIKIGDSWSVRQLETALEEQLSGKYLQHKRCSVGCLLITYAGRKTFQHPDTKEVLPFEAVIVRLQEQAAQLEKLSLGLLRLAVFGIDLRRT